MVKSEPPHGNFGPSKRSRKLRPQLPFDEKQIEEMRKRRRNEESIEDIASSYSHSTPKWQICAVGIFRRGQEKVAVHSGSMDKTFDEPTAKKYAAPRGYAKNGL